MGGSRLSKTGRLMQRRRRVGTASRLGRTREGISILEIPRACCVWGLCSFAEVRSETATSKPVLQRPTHIGHVQTPDDARTACTRRRNDSRPLLYIEAHLSGSLRSLDVYME